MKRSFSKTDLQLADIDWRHCFICQQKHKKDLASSQQALQTVADNITEFQNAGELDLVWNAITQVTDDEGHRSSAATLNESLQVNKACYHRSCGSRYNKQKLARLSEKQEASSSTPFTRSSVEKKDFAGTFCAICNKSDIPENLHARGSFHASKRSTNRENNCSATERWKSMALKVGNETLLKHLSTGDASSNELFYHSQCNKDLYNQCIKIDKENSSRDIETKWRRAQAFESIVSFLLEQEAVEPGSTFGVKDLNKLYIENLKSFGIEEKTQTTRFTERLLESIPNLSSATVNQRNVVLFDYTVHELVADYVNNPDEFYTSLRKVVHPIRTDIMQQKNSFTGSYDSSSQVKSVPKTVVALTCALIDGEMTSSAEPSQEALTVAQLIVSQMRRPSKREAKLKKPSRRRHCLDQETPLLQYVGMKVFYITRSRQLIEDLYHVGLSISYDRVLELTKIFYEELRRAYVLHSCFFPRILRKFLFTVWLKDNIDVNPKANFNKSSYHGTSSSIVQFRTSVDDGKEFPQIAFNNKVSIETKKLAPLPADYASVKDVYPAKFKTELWAPASPDYQSPSEFPNFDIALAEECKWLLDFTDGEIFSPGWAAYHAAQKRGVHSAPGINTILPLHRDKVSTFNMQAHLMELNMKWTETLNPGQTPVDVSDQPVYALTKELQFRFPQKFGKYFPLFGQLHIEQCLLVIHGQLIKGSGLFEILTENKFSMIGLSAVVDVNNIKRARYTLQISLCALFKQLRLAMPEHTNLSPYEWLKEQSKVNTSFLYWKIVMDLQILNLLYIRSLREGNFQLHVEVLLLLLIWIFLFNHFHYSRWLTVQWFDLYTLESKFPDVYQHFLSGNFSFQKTNREFSRMGLDQVHEQNNKVIKGAGGASNLLNKDNDSALLRWEVCNPEIARMILEFEDCLDRNDIPAESSSKHHEDNASFNKRFSSDVDRLSKAITVNPFKQTSLTKLNNHKIVISDSVRDVLENLEPMGREQVKTFIQDRLVSRKVPISETIKSNNIEIWNHNDKAEKVQFLPAKSVLKQMNSACEYRKELAEELFENEIFNIPHSLFVDGKSGIEMYHGAKSEITKRFNSSRAVVQPFDGESKSAIVIEMSPLVKSKAFATDTSNLADFSEFSLLIYYEVMRLASNYDRIDLVFDRYFERSLKEGTRTGRGEGSNYLFEGDSTEIPFKMADCFLKNNDNKNNLYEYLATKLLELYQGDQIMITTYRNTTLCSQSACLELDQHTCVRPCESEEADQRLVRHTLNLVQNGYKNILVRTIDTDVLVLLISHVRQLVEYDDVQLYAYLINSDKHYDLRSIIEQLGSDICQALPYFYAFTGCDTVSSFYGKGKCKAYDVWIQSKQKQQLTDVFRQLGEKPATVTVEQINILEKYVLELYGATHATLGASRLDKFNKSKDNNLRSLPPSKGALIQQIYRASYQAGYLWWQSVEELNLPEVEEWGWQLDTNRLHLKPTWTLQQSSVIVKDFVSTCSCKTGKCKTCNCARRELACLSMCGCSRGCIGNFI